MRYLTYDEYINIGGTLDETSFKRVIVAACAVVDMYTQNRLQAAVEISEKVHYCVRDLCEYLDINNGMSYKAVTSKSQSAGGVSESESYATKSSDDVKAEMYNIVYMYLSTEYTEEGVPLMYKGASGAVGKLVTKRLKAKFNVKYDENDIDIPVVTYRE